MACVYEEEEKKAKAVEEGSVHINSSHVCINEIVASRLLEEEGIVIQSSQVRNLRGASSELVALSLASCACVKRLYACILFIPAPLY